MGHFRALPTGSWDRKQHPLSHTGTGATELNRSLDNWGRAADSNPVGEPAGRKGEDEATEGASQPPGLPVPAPTHAYSQMFGGQ